MNSSRYVQEFYDIVIHGNIIQINGHNFMAWIQSITAIYNCELQPITLLLQEVYCFLCPFLFLLGFNLNKKLYTWEIRPSTPSLLKIYVA